jgi:hypothetical protein
MPRPSIKISNTRFNELVSTHLEYQKRLTWLEIAAISEQFPQTIDAESFLGINSTGILLFTDAPAKPALFPGPVKMSII